MGINILFTGILSEVTETSFRYYSKISTLDDLIHRIEDEFPGIKNYDYRILINNKAPCKNQQLADDDIVTLIQPLAKK
jgi:molybdopterin converting factor small subunit